MSKDLFTTECSLDRINNYRHPDGRSVIDLGQYEEIKLNIRPNKDVAPGKFRPDPLLPGGHIAHPTTIRAMRKDIFVTGYDVDLNEKLINCPNCGTELDLQFYIFCPFCECQQID